MKAFITLLLTLFLATETAAHADTESGWTQALDKDGISVWTRSVPGFPVHEFRAVTTVHSTLTALVDLVMDTGSAPAWVFRTKRIDLLRRDDSKAEFLVHVVTDFPWPLRDRDVLVQGNIRQDSAGTVTILSRSAPGAQNEDGCCVHMPYFSGTWIFRPLGKGLTEVTLQGLADPGGIIPAGIVNLIIHETPYQTLRGLRRVIGNPRYQSATMPQIHEP